MARKDPISHLGRHLRPPPRLIEEILSLGRPGLEQLVAIVNDQSRWVTEEAAAANALVVLGRAKDPIGLPCAVLAHARSEFDSTLYATAGYALESLIDLDNYGLLLQADLDDRRRDDATVILVEAGVRDPALVPCLEGLLQRDPKMGGPMCVIYGDPALVPALTAAFDACLAPDSDDPESIELASDLAEALTALNGEDEGRTHRLKLALIAANSRMRDEIYALEGEIAHAQELARPLERDPELWRR